MIPLLLALGTGTAQADPWVDAHLGTSIGVTGEEPGALALGAGYSVGIAEPVRAELRVDGHVLSDGSARAAAGPALRLYFVRPDKQDAVRPALVLNGGVAITDKTHGLLGAGVDVDLPTGWPNHSRVGAGVWTDLGETWAVGLRLGVVGRPWTRKPEPLVVTPPPVDGESWWDPQTCAWVDADPGNGWQTEDGVSLPGESSVTQLGAPDPADPNSTGPVLERPQGWLMVVAEPGDVVQLGPMSQEVGRDGVARLRAAEGIVEVSVVGGGRSQAFEAAVADGYALWLRAAPPEEVRVQFASGSSVVDEQDRVLIQALARNRGSYHLRISGSYSPEGSQVSNLALARDRADAVNRLLVDAGVPADGVTIDPPTPPRPGLTAEQQRAVYVQPVTATETP